MEEREKGRGDLLQGLRGDRRPCVSAWLTWLVAILALDSDSDSAD